MSKSRLLAISLLSAFGLLTGCSKSAESSRASAAPSAPTADLANGKAVFERVCAACHQPTGLGLPGAFPPLAGSEILTRGDGSTVVRIVLHGLQGPITVGGNTFNSVMPPQGPMLKDNEISDAISYARSSWGNRASAVSEATVRTLRATVKHDGMWTWPDLDKETGGK